MNTPSNDARRLAEDALFQITAAMEYVEMIGSAAHLIGDQLKDDPQRRHLATVARMAAFNAEDWHNMLDCAREELKGRLAAVFGEEPHP
ncbi:hypothetical protein [Metapseudomonas otitidis]|uniref:hypothetical protein n=1 Tax=Metapseudomonas otitidis TaxID=319939 RepID=UPI0013F627E7|nr:hypothetical protein [Pseudomonas otitidis]